jgi:hypothetical protein
VVTPARRAERGAASTAPHDDIVSKIDETLTSVSSTIAGWSPSTASRAAEMDYQRRLKDGVEKLNKALDTVRTKLAEVATDAHEAEVTNVAIVD